MTDGRGGAVTAGDGPVGPAPWWWRCVDGAGADMPRADPRFGSRQGAEDWLGEVFDDLAEDGVAAVTLMDGDRPVYGPMSLAEG